MSNADCVAQYGAGQQCVVVTGPNIIPGAVCFPKAAPMIGFSVEPTDPRDICLKNPADAPEQKRLAGGAACARDCDCASAFCDRGICAGSASLRVEHYGKGPCKKVLLPNGRAVFPLLDMCEAYVCVDQRCRSCKEDAECQDGDRASRCLSFPGLPGKQCEDPDQRLRHPEAPRPRRKPETPVMLSRPPDVPP